MREYFLLTLKRLFKVFPYIMAAVSILFICLFAAFGAALNAEEDQGQTRFRLALVSNDNDPFFLTGLNIVQDYDSTRFSVDTVQMEEFEAHEALKQGELDAYVVIPDGYIRDAVDGKLGSLKYVSTTGTKDLIALFKDEITAVVSHIIISCEKGMYGVEHLAADYDFESRAAAYAGEISLKYVDYILDRADMYYVDELGTHDSLGFDGYLFSGISVLVLSVMLIPAGVCFINRDLSVQALLKSRNVNEAMQVMAEYIAFAIVLMLPVAVLGCFASLFQYMLPAQLFRLLQIFTYKNLIGLFIIILNISALGFLLFQCADELVGGILLYFFSVLALCFVSGCIYPDYFFPDILRNLSQYTPQGISRSLIANMIVGKEYIMQAIILSAYTVLLLFVSVFIRSVRLSGKKR